MNETSKLHISNQYITPLNYRTLLLNTQTSLINQSFEKRSLLVSDHRISERRLLTSFFSKTSGESYSATRPSDITSTLSESMIVLIRWAIYSSDVVRHFAKEAYGDSGNAVEV